MIGIKELAEYIGLKPQTIRNKINNGTFPLKPKKLCGLLKWDIKEIDQYLDKLPRM